MPKAKTKAAGSGRHSISAWVRWQQWASRPLARIRPLPGSAISSGSITGLMATVCGLGTTVLGYLNISSIGAIAGQIQKAYPEQYPEEGTTLNGTLIRDSSLVYFSSPIGALLGLANIGMAAGYVYCMLK